MSISRAGPGWWTDSEDHHRKWPPASVQAEDDLGGTYLSILDGGTGHRDHEELTLQFLPRLDPLARAVKLTFTGASEQVARRSRSPTGRQAAAAVTTIDC